MWWLRLGIAIERIKPGHPEQNGRHERMHLTLKTEATRPASPNFLHQQARFDAFLARYNHERPHQALGMKVPGELYTHSPRPYQGLGELDYPGHDWTVTVTRCGRICYTRRKINLSRAFAGQNVGVKQVSEKIWLVSFMHYDLGYFDDETCRLGCLLRSLLIGQLPRAPVDFSHEPSRWGGVRQARVRQPWKAGPEHRGLRLICDKVRPTAAVPMHRLQGNRQHKHGDRLQRSSLHATGVRAGRQPARRRREPFRDRQSHGAFP